MSFLVVLNVSCFLAFNSSANFEFVSISNLVNLVDLDSEVCDDEYWEVLF